MTESEPSKQLRSPLPWKAIWGLLQGCFEGWKMTVLGPALRTEGTWRTWWLNWRQTERRLRPSSLACRRGPRTRSRAHAPKSSSIRSSEGSMQREWRAELMSMGERGEEPRGVTSERHWPRFGVGVHLAYCLLPNARSGVRNFAAAKDPGGWQHLALAWWVYHWRTSATPCSLPHNAVQTPRGGREMSQGGRQIATLQGA